MPENASFDQRQMTNREFASLGLQDVAYVKAVHVDGQDVFAIHAADGRQIAIAATHVVAAATVRQNDLEPLSVH